jgi:bacteriocin-like protein
MKENQHLQELSKDELTSINGGGFAYDFGYALRFLAISVNGPGGGGMALTDYFLNYHPR